MKQGILTASFEYPDRRDARRSTTALKILAGQTVPKEITLSSRVFTPQTIDAGGEWLKEP